MLKTPFYDIHCASGAQIAPFGGWLMPIQYQGILAEHQHTREKVSVFDICHMGEFMLQADPALSGFDRIVTQKIISMPIGACRYGFMLNEQAGVLDDLIVYRINKTKWMLVVNAATISNDEAHLKKNLIGKYEFENISNKMGKLDVQGPDSRDVLEGIFGNGISKLNYYAFAEFVFGQEKCIISRTGYTGELGYEVYILNDHAIELWKVLLGDSRVKPAGLGCRDTLRLEMSYPLYGQDLDIHRTPLEAGLEKFVDFSKDFIGKDALLKEQKSGIKESLVCFQGESRRSPRHGFAIFAQGERVGTVTSGSFSPSLSVGIGMGYVSGKRDLGTELMVKDTGVEIPVKIVQKPFYHGSSK